MRNLHITHRRWLLWLPLLGISAYLALQEPPADAAPDVVRPVGRSEPPPAVDVGASRSTPSVALLSLTPREQLFVSPTGSSGDARSSPDLFQFRSWTPPPPPPPPPPAPSAPTAPPLPFTFLGKKLQDGQWEVFLGNGDFTYVVREGQTFAAAYQVQSIQPPNMTLVYVPLKQSQTLAIGSGL
jgi:hypothetical protein